MDSLRGGTGNTSKSNVGALLSGGGGSHSSSSFKHTASLPDLMNSKRESKFQSFKLIPCVMSFFSVQT